MSKPADPPREKAALPTASDLLAFGSRSADLIAHSAWNEARETVMALVNAGPALVALLGPPGTGKTALLRDLATTFGELGRAVCLLDSGDSSLDVGLAEIVLVDEADRISATRVEEFRSRSGVAVVLAALPASRERFESYPDVSVVQLAPLSSEEACKFVAERLARLGLPSGCLTEEARAQLIAHSRGVPRLLVGFLGSALFIAGEEHAACVTGSHVEEAVEARGGSLELSAVELAVVEPDPAQEGVAEIPAGAEGARTEGGLDWVGATPPPRQLPSKVVVGLYLATVVASYLVPAAALLTWDMYRQMDKTTSSGFGTEQVAAAAPTAAVSTVSPPPVAVAMGSDNAASPQFQAPIAATGTTANLTSGGLPSRILPNTAQRVGPPAWAPPGPVLPEGAPAMGGRSMTLNGASGIDQRGSAVGKAQLTEPDAKIARRTQDAAALSAERDRLQSQSQKRSGELAEASWPVAKLRRPVVQTPHPDAQMTDRQVLHREPYRGLASMPRQTTTRELPLPVRQLLSARRALVGNNSSEARGLLEAAQTTIVFEPRDTASERAGVAAAQIANALSMLNSGDAVSAVPYLDRAITAMRPTS